MTESRQRRECGAGDVSTSRLYVSKRCVHSAYMSSTLLVFVILLVAATAALRATIAEPTLNSVLFDNLGKEAAVVCDGKIEDMVNQVVPAIRANMTLGIAQTGWGVDVSADPRYCDPFP